MSGQELFRALGNIREEYIEEAEFVAVPVRRLRRPLFIAAAVLLVLALVGCAVVYAMKMENLKLGEQTGYGEYWPQDEPNPIRVEVPETVLTLSGLKGSANYQAALEWYDFNQNYDPDGTLREEAERALVENPSQRFPEAYDFYHVYTQEMTNQIDDIAGRYGLSLMGPEVEAYSARSLRSYLGIETLLIPGAPASLSYDSISPCYFEGGYFRLSFDLHMEDGADWPFAPACEYVYSPKDCFNGDFCTLEGENWREWNYTTASGHELLILRSDTDYRGWVFCDRGDATVSLRVETRRDLLSDWDVESLYLSDRQLELMTDCIDFSVAPSPGDPALLDGLPAGAPEGYDIKVKDVVTDGRKLYITLGLCVPEGVSLTGPDGGSTVQLGLWNLGPMGDGERRYYSWSGQGLEDGDGRDTTMDYRLRLELPAGAVQAGRDTVWSLYIEDMLCEHWDEENPAYVRDWTAEGVWRLDFSTDDHLLESLAFVNLPLTISAIAGWSMYPEGGEEAIWEEVTLTGLRLRAFGAEAEFEGGRFADLSGGSGEEGLRVLLADGTEIALDGNLEPRGDIWAEKTEPIPLEEVVAMHLPDGTRLEPIKP